MTAFAKWLENTSWVTTLTNSQWMYSVCEISHYFSLFVAIGTIVIVDLRILGLAGRRQPLLNTCEGTFSLGVEGFALCRDSFRVPHVHDRCG